MKMKMNNTNDFELMWPKLKEINASGSIIDNGTGQIEKLLAILILGLGSFGAGMLPATISQRNRRRFPLTISILLCFGAGILLATALVHILPEVRAQMSSNWAEVTLCIGFFFIYFIDEFIHYFFGENSMESSSNHMLASHQNCSEQCDALIHTETESLINFRRRCHCHGTNTTDYQSAHCCDEELLENATATHTHTHAHASLCRGNHGIEQQQLNTNNIAVNNTVTGTLGLFVALSLHSAIEGLAIGVQNSSSKVLFLLGAIACHKFVMSFCLGLELHSNPQATGRSQLCGIVIFSLGAICGICVGMLLVDVPSTGSTTALPIIQSLAGGTLLYVTTCEVIPREKAKWHHNPTYRAARFYQLFSVASGFCLMCLINFYLDDDS